MREDIKDKIKIMPEKPGCYLMKDKKMKVNFFC